MEKNIMPQLIAMIGTPASPAQHRPALQRFGAVLGLLTALGSASVSAAPTSVDALNDQCSARITSASYKSAEAVCQSAIDRAAAQAAGTYTQARALRNLAALNRDLGRYDLAQPLLEQALKIGEQLTATPNKSQADQNNYELITSLSDLALLYQIQGRQTAAEKPLQQALELSDKTRGADSRSGAEARYRLGLLYYDQHRYTDAEPLLAAAVATAEKRIGANDATTVAMRDTLARVEKELAASAAPGLSNSIGPGPNP